MGNFGLTAQGFKPKRLADILSELNADLAKIKDPVTGEHLDPSTDPLIAQIAYVLTPGLAECWEAAAQAANQFDPNKATGACLAGLVQINGIQKFPGTKTQVLMLLHGTGTLEAGQEIGNTTGTVVFITDSEVEFVDGAATVTATCSVVGAISPINGAINNILTPSERWISAQNINTIVVGTNPEADNELRFRQQSETANTAYRQVDAIQAAIINIAGVVFCKVYQNKSATDVDSRNLPPKSICALVEGGQNKDVAEAIFKRSPAGMDYFGNTNVTLYDNQGFDYLISFLRPIPVIITAIIDISILDSSFPADGAEQIANSIVNFTQFKGGNIGIAPGHNVILSRLYTPINSIPGHQVNSILLSRDNEPPTADNIVIAWNEAAQFIAYVNYFTADDDVLCADQSVSYMANAPQTSITVTIS